MILCSCGCGLHVAKKTQQRHLQGKGPIMAVAGVIETRAYFGNKRRADKSEPSRPRKRQRVTVYTPEPHSLPQQGEWHTPLPENIPPAPSPAAAATTLPSDPTTPKVTCAAALSAPWSGPADFRYCDSDAFEDSNDINNDKVRLDPIVDDSDANVEDSDMDSDTYSETDLDGSSSGDRLGGFNPESVPDIFETDAEMSAAEHSEWMVAPSCCCLEELTSKLNHTQHLTILGWTTLTSCVSFR